jgi:hypothetical protein
MDDGQQLKCINKARRETQPFSCSLNLDVLSVGLEALVFYSAIANVKKKTFSTFSHVGGKQLVFYDVFHTSKALCDKI